MTLHSGGTGAEDGLLVYVGTYTEAPQGRAEGVYVLRLDLQTGALARLQTVPGVDNPSYLALAPDGGHLYAVSEVDEGRVVSFARASATGHLTLLNRQSSQGAAPCHLSTVGGHVLVANYTSGTVAALPIRPDGSLSPAASVVQHAGSSSHPRQEGPHAHMILADPSDRFIMAVDLGLDQILAYRLDVASGRMAPSEPALAYESPRPGAGPRQIAFLPNGHHAFVLNELDSTLTACEYDPARGVLRPFQTLSTLPGDFAGENTCAHVAIAPSGRFVYASNRGHDSVAIFAIEDASGHLAELGHEPTGGATPRAFAIDPGGTWLLAGNQDTGTIVSFRVDTSTGLLTPSGEAAEVPAPVCVVFADSTPHGV